MTDGFYDVEHKEDGDRTVAQLRDREWSFLGYACEIRLWGGQEAQEQARFDRLWTILRGPYEIAAPAEEMKPPVSVWDGGFDESGQTMNPAWAPFRTRLAGPDDEELAQAWTEADPDHRGRMTGKFWTDQNGCQSRILFRGYKPMFFFRLEHGVRMHIQFAPDKDVEARELRTTLESGMRWLGSVLASTGVRELVFDSTSRLLRRFCTGRLQFIAEPDTLKRNLVDLPQRK